MRIGGSERAARTRLIIGLDLREGQTSTFRIVEFDIGTLLFLGNNVHRKMEIERIWGNWQARLWHSNCSSFHRKRQCVSRFEPPFLRGHMVFRHGLSASSGVRSETETYPRPGTDAPSVGAVPGFLALLSQASHFRRPLTGHCARAAPYSGSGPYTFNTHNSRSRAAPATRLPQGAPANVSLATIWL